MPTVRLQCSESSRSRSAGYRKLNQYCLPAAVPNILWAELKARLGLVVRSVYPLTDMATICAAISAP